MSETTRRGVIRKGVGLVAGLAGFGTAASATATDLHGGARLRLFAIGLSASAHGRPRGRLAELDDHISSHAELLDGPAGQPIGVFAGTGLVVRSPFLDGLSTIEQHVFVLRDGTITGSGHAVGGVGTFAVTGGTGRYTAVRGSYAATLDPFGFGGDGTARFEFNLTS